jgi:hypothetical protein
MPTIDGHGLRKRHVFYKKVFSKDTTLLFAPTQLRLLDLTNTVKLYCYNKNVFQQHDTDWLLRAAEMERVVFLQNFRLIQFVSA